MQINKHGMGMVRFQGQLNSARKNALNHLGVDDFRAVTQALEAKRDFIEKELSDDVSVILEHNGKINVSGKVPGFNHSTECFKDSSGEYSKENDIEKGVMDIPSWVASAMDTAKQISEETKQARQTVADKEQAWTEYLSSQKESPKPPEGPTNKNIKEDLVAKICSWKIF